MNKLIGWCLKNRFLTLAVLFLAILLGVHSLLNIPVDALPDIGENQQIVIADWPGRDAQTIEDQVTFPLTTRLLGIPGIKTVRASSAFGFSMVYLIFKDEVKFYDARSRILEKLQSAGAFLPEGVMPVLGPDATSLGQVFWYTVEGGGLDPSALRTLQDWTIRYQLNAVDGVSEVASIGGFVRQYQIILDPDRLAVAGLTAEEIVEAVRSANLDVGARVVEKGGMEFILRGVGLLRNIEDIRSIGLSSVSGTPVRLEHVAEITEGPEFRRGLLEKDGQEAVGGVVIVRYGENSLQVIRRVKERIKEIEAGLPEGVRIVPFYDRTNLIKRVINTLRETLILQILVTMLVVFIFLGQIRSALIISSTLPVAIVLSFIVMHRLGIDSNIMSLGGIAIAIGALVDTGIIMTDNINRHLALRQPGASFTEAIRSGAAQVSAPILTAVLTTVISFLPVFALEAQEGKLFKPLAFTKTFALTASILLALTAVPVLASFLLKKEITDETRTPAAVLIRRFYERILRFILPRKKAFLLLPLLAVLTGGVLLVSLGNEFMPPFDEGSILFMPVVAPSVSLTEAKRIMTIQNEIIRSFPEVENVVGKAGRAETATDPAPIEMFETVINLKPKKKWRRGMTKEKLIHDMDNALNFPGVANIWTQPIINRIDMLSTGIRTPVGIKIFGPDPAALEETAEEIRSILLGVRGAEDIYAEKINGKPYLEIAPDRNRIARYGLTMKAVLSTVEMVLGGENVTTVFDGRRRFPVSVRYHRESRESIEAIGRILLRTPGGSRVSLSQIAEIRLREGPAMISSENGQLRAYVLLNVRGRDMVGFVKEARRKVAEGLIGKMPPGTSLEWAGQFENQVRAGRRLGLLIPISLLINYLIIFMNFRSHWRAGIVFMAVPITLSGGIILLALMGFNLSIAVWVGFIALFGIAVDDGVLILTYLDEVFKSKQPATTPDIREAVVEAGLARIRPAFMTSITTVLALLPIFLIGGTGIEVMRPMAIPSLGGMFFGPLSWFTVPVIYSWIHERRLKKKLKPQEAVS